MSDHWGGAANSFFNPLRSDVHGAFGSSSLILLAILAPLASLKARHVRVMATLWLLLTVIFLCSIGGDTPVYYLFWRIVPFASSFRVPGRITMLLIPILLLLLCWYFRAVDDESLVRDLHSIASWHLALIALALFVAGSFLLAHARTGSYTPFNIQHYPSWIDTVIFLIGVASFSLLGLRASRWHARRYAGLLLSVFVILQAMVQFRSGTWLENRKPTKSLEQLDDSKRQDLIYRGAVGHGMESASADEASNGDEPVSREGYHYSALPLAVFRTSETNSVVPVSPQHFLVPGRPVDTLYAAFNRLVFHTDSPSPGFLALSVPYSAQWHALVGSHEYEVSQTDQRELAVFLPPGAHDVDFRFHSPSSVVGMLITCGTALFIVVAFSRNCRSKWLRFTLVVTAIVVLGGGFAMWERSFYHGDDMGTQFRWVGTKQ
jgi:hypothetical protein